jgi:hypothetical protein
MLGVGFATTIGLGAGVDAETEGFGVTIADLAIASRIGRNREIQVLAFRSTDSYG